MHNTPADAPMRRGARDHLQLGLNRFRRQLKLVFANPVFFVLSLVGNAALALSAALFYAFERGINPNLDSFGDAVWWAFVTVTTVGYGDIFPVTPLGRGVALVLMLTGGVLFLTFVALLSSTFLQVEMTDLEKEVHWLRNEVRRLAEFERRAASDGA